MGIFLSVLVCIIHLFWVRKYALTPYTKWSLILVFYLAFMINELVGFPSLAELFKMSALGVSLLRPHLNLIPFSQGFDISSLLNIFLFIPLGIALPVMWEKFDKLVPTIIYGAILSFIIEIGQLFTIYRQTDVNDVMFNTLGIVLGWLIAKYILKWQARNDELPHNYDWLILPFLIILTCFIF